MTACFGCVIERWSLTGELALSCAAWNRRDDGRWTGRQVSRRPAQAARVSRPLNQVPARTETGSATGRTPEVKHGLLYNSTYYNIGVHGWVH